MLSAVDVFLDFFHYFLAFEELLSIGIFSYDASAPFFTFPLRHPARSRRLANSWLSPNFPPLLSNTPTDYS